MKEKSSNQIGKKATKETPPLPKDWLKWNTDATRILTTGLSTVGMACANNKGTIITSQSKKIGILVLVAEAFAIREALRMARQHSIDKIMVESDS